MRCTQCGAENVADAQFCASCGQPIAGAPAQYAPAAYAQPAATPPGYAPQPAYAPQQVYAPQPAPAAAPPRKKKRGCLVTALILIGVLLLGCGAVAWGLTSLVKPKDLGVTYTEADYQSAVTKFGVKMTDSAPGLPAEKTKTVYKGKKKVNTRLSSAEVSAVVSMHRRAAGQTLRDVQILLGDNNRLQMSGFAVFNGVSYPFYTDLTMALASPRSVGGSAQNIVVWGVDLPQQYWGAATEFLFSAINERLAAMGAGLSIDTATISGGELTIIGQVPASADGVPLAGEATSTPTATPTP
jgi:hypothetical protein